MPLTRLQPKSKRDFILQQGLTAPNDPESESLLFSALQFQPRLIGGLVLAGVGFQSPKMFLVIGAALWWSAIAPGWNPFNALHNHTLGAKRGLYLLGSAPPRIFAEAMGGSLAIGIAVLLALGQNGAALLLEGVFLLGNAAVVFSRSCFGAFLFSWLESRPFANRLLSRPFQIR